MLVYRGPDGGMHSETLPNTRRRKKSTGELFQKGYRVRMGHGHVAEKDDQDSIWYSLGACFHVISYWGKTRRTRGRLARPGAFGLCVSAGAGSGSGFANVLRCPSGRRSLKMRNEPLARHTTVHILS